MTKVGLRIKRRIARLLANPIEGARQAPAVRNEEKSTLAKSKRKKARSPAQIAAFKKMRAALKAKHGTTDISKIRGRKRSKKRSTRREEEEEMLLENAAKKKKRGKKRGKKRSKKAATPRKRKTTKRKPAKAKAPKRRKARKPRKAAAPKRKRKKSRRKAKTAKTARTTVAGKIHVVKLPGRTIVKEIRVEAAKKRTKKRKKKGHGGARPSHEELMLLENPMSEGLGGYEALFENPMGPYSTSSLKGFGWAAGGVGLGLVVAELVDRYIATRTPADSKSGGPDAKGNNPWFGRDAAAAMQRRPDALRLGVQAVGALAGIGGAYALRGRSIAPWLIGGTAVGFGANLFKQLIMWWVAPRILKAKENEAVLGNRLLPLEQVELQDKIDAIWEDWQKVASLMDNQKVAGTPVVVSPLSASPSQNVLTLGGATGNGPLPGAVGFVSQPGRVGACMSCGGMQGCWSNCPALNCPDDRDCKDCSPHDGDGGGQRGRLCEYVVQRGDDLTALVTASGVPANDIAALNGGGDPSTWWRAGATVVLPEQACYVVWRHQNGGNGDGNGGGDRQPPPSGEPLIQERPNGGDTPFIPRPEEPVRSIPPARPTPGAGPFYRAIPTAPPAGGAGPFLRAIPQAAVTPTVKGVGEVSDEMQRQIALRSIGGEESEQE